MVADPLAPCAAMAPADMASAAPFQGQEMIENVNMLCLLKETQYYMDSFNQLEMWTISSKISYWLKQQTFHNFKMLHLFLIRDKELVMVTTFNISCELCQN